MHVILILQYYSSLIQTWKLVLNNPISVCILHYQLSKTNITLYILPNPSLTTLSLSLLSSFLFIILDLNVLCLICEKLSTWFILSYRFIIIFFNQPIVLTKHRSKSFLSIWFHLNILCQILISFTLNHVVYVLFAKFCLSSLLKLYHRIFLVCVLQVKMQNVTMFKFSINVQELTSYTDQTTLHTPTSKCEMLLCSEMRCFISDDMSDVSPNWNVTTTTTTTKPESDGDDQFLYNPNDITRFWVAEVAGLPVQRCGFMKYRSYRDEILIQIDWSTLYTNIDLSSISWSIFSFSLYLSINHLMI